MREIVIGVPDARGLVLYHCDGCRRNEWQRAGRTLSPDQALETARAMDAEAAGG